jgi:hypothetical protein
LRDIDSRACPECGRGFDPGDPRTTSYHPGGGVRRGFALAGCVLAAGVGVAALAAVISSAMAVDPLVLFLGGLLLTPFVLILLVLCAIPPLPIRGRVRLGALLAVAVLVSVVITNWPFWICFAVHRPAFQRLADGFRKGDPQVVKGSRWVGVLHVRRIRATPNGNVGFQLSGGDGGGMYIVHRAPGVTWTWDNTNWEHELGDGWVRVYQD